MRMKRFYFSFLLFIAGLFLWAIISSSLSSPCEAGVLDDKLKELEQMQKDIDNYRNQIESKKRTEQSITKELEKLEMQLTLSEKELSYIRARIQYLTDRVQETKTEIAAIEAKLESQKKAFNERLVAMYKAGSISYLEVLLDSKSLSDFMARLYYLREIAQQDARLIEEYNAAHKDLLDKKAALEKDLQDLSASKREEEQKRAVLASRSQDRERYLAQVQADRKKLEQALDEMERESKALEKIIQELQAQGHRPEKASLSMIRPVSGGWISSYYGNRLHPILNYYRWHSGIDIAVDAGTPIKAAEDGTVIFAGMNGGYGNCVILDHGGGISTLYAHASRILVTKGQEVSKGQTIALVGSTGLSTGPHLHFEVRVNGQTQDPLKWIP
ncbi:MAG: peptidoglycan DD-metalloendopeptidase family protein [Candidatus Fermentithermobacillus carboniphilus]|uniref:Peptidoglycan DD-metalloendopeptidase family protein n=1 Tax=Candidatus Fermentithermobacillus carboniphilus TaxID=3085328 RepID=A0AAT9LCB2_9FIRM|nr:MAG: peptidoglycan DD-metalloendopeptidase family protein [Candidatus Fermentithermobacillus carboniphilus]